MNPMFIEVIQSHLDKFVTEMMNDKVRLKASNGFFVANTDLAYERGYLNGICTAFNLSYDKEGDFWVVRNGRRTIIAKCKENSHGEEEG